MALGGGRDTTAGMLNWVQPLAMEEGVRVAEWAVRVPVCKRDVNRYWSLTLFGIFRSTEYRIWHGMPSVHSVKEDHQGELRAENWD